MKKLHLKKWVKVVLVIVLLAIVVKYSTDYNRKQIVKCVEEGNTINFCKYHLSK